MIELKRFVEKVVRPVPTPDVHRKLRMREELYAHVMDAYEHELQLCGDETEATHKAIARMGDPEDLAAELRATTSRLDRASYWFTRHFERRPAEGLWAWAARITLIVSVLMLIEFSAACLFNCNEIINWTANGRITLRLMGALGMIFCLGTFLLTPLAEGAIVRMALQNSWMKATGTALWIAASSFPVLLSLGSAAYVIAAWTPIDLPAAVHTMFPSALIVSLILAGVCVITAGERRLTAPWLEMEIDG